MNKPETNENVAEKSILGKIGLTWVFVVFMAYIVVASMQIFALYPIESRLLPLYSQYASLIYLPHAVRVLATAIYGPRAFWVLLPAILFTTYMFYPPVNGHVSVDVLLLAVIGAACAPIGYMALKLIGMIRSDFDYNNSILNWRYIFTAGVIASAINSIGLTAVFFGLSDIRAAALAMGRFFIGDIIGLFVGLVVLTWVFRMLRKAREGDV